MQIGRSYLGVPSCMTKYRYVRIKIHKSKIMSGTWMPLEAVEVGQIPATNREVTFRYAFMYIFDESIEILTLANLYLDIYEGIPKFDLFYT